MAGKQVLDPDLLTPKDMKRARKLLTAMAVASGDEDMVTNPWELLEDPDERFTLTIWCLKSRTDPSFTWEQAEDTPFSEFDPPTDPNLPRSEAPSSPGSRPKASGKTGRKPRHLASVSEPKSEGTTVSPETSTTS